MLLLNLAACIVSVHNDFVPEVRPTAAADAGEAVSGKTCNMWLLGFISSRPRDQEGTAKLLAELAGDEFHTVVGVSVDTRWWWAPLAVARCEYISGRRVLVE